MPLRDPEETGQQIGEYCVALLKKVIPHLEFETEDEIHRFCFGAGIVILTLAKDNAAGFAAPAGIQYVRALCDAIERPFVAMIKRLDISVPAITFLPTSPSKNYIANGLI